MGKIHQTAHIADGVQIAGDVYLGENANVWYNAVLRTSDTARIIVGDDTNIQDGCIFHASSGKDVTVGKGVTVGHGAIVHCCSIGDNTIIGMGAIIMTGASVGKNCVIGAGALVTEGTVIPDGSMAFGSPARIRRNLSEEEIEHNKSSALQYVNEAREVLK